MTDPDIIAATHRFTLASDGISMECERCGAHRSDVPCMTEADRLRLVARLEAAEKALKTSADQHDVVARMVKNSRTAPNVFESIYDTSVWARDDARRALAGKDAA